MSPSEKLTAAAERVEQLLDAGHQIPWEATHFGSRTGKSLIAPIDSWTSHAEATADSADLIVAAVNAMPALAEWLTCAGEDIATDAATAGKDEDDYIEPIPFYRLAVAIADQILGGE